MATKTDKGILLEAGTNEVEFIEFFIAGVSYGINVAKVQRVVAFRDVEVDVEIPFEVAEVLLEGPHLRGVDVEGVDVVGRPEPPVGPREDRGQPQRGRAQQKNKAGLQHRSAAYQAISEAARLSIADFRRWLDGLELEPFERKVAATILEELSDRIRFLDEVGLGYLTLDRQARTLSGGEMQRIRLATCLGSNLVETLYVLDEPTIGLHARDVSRFLSVLSRLRNLGNTVLVIEHNLDLIKAADWIIDMGPEGGRGGGEIIAQGTPEKISEVERSHTGKFLKEEFERLEKETNPA